MQRSDDANNSAGTEDLDADPDFSRGTSLTPLPDGYDDPSARQKRRSAPGDDSEDDRPTPRAKKARPATLLPFEDEEIPPPKRSKGKGRARPSDDCDDGDGPARSKRRTRRR